MDYKETIQQMIADGVLTREDAAKYCPELIESEDWIPKEIIKYLKEKGDFRSCWITWLEKQGEQKPVFIVPKFRVGDTIRLKGSLAEYTIESISGECYHGKGWKLHISCDDDYELVEQKPADWSEEDEHMLNTIIYD